MVLTPCKTRKEDVPFASASSFLIIYRRHTLTTVKPLDKGQKLAILVAGNTISAPGATAITAYTLDGQVAAQSASTISALAKGLYIVKATDATGRQTTAKVVVR